MLENSQDEAGVKAALWRLLCQRPIAQKWEEEEEEALQGPVSDESSAVDEVATRRKAGQLGRGRAISSEQASDKRTGAAVARGLVEALRPIVLLLERQSLLRFVGSSVLVVFEGDQEAWGGGGGGGGGQAHCAETGQHSRQQARGGGGGHPRVTVHLIDFGHVYPLKEALTALTTAEAQATARQHRQQPHPALAGRGSGSKRAAEHAVAAQGSNLPQSASTITTPPAGASGGGGFLRDLNCLQGLQNLFEMVSSFEKERP